MAGFHAQHQFAERLGLSSPSDDESSDESSEEDDDDEAHAGDSTNTMTIWEPGEEEPGKFLMRPTERDIDEEANAAE